MSKFLPKHLRKLAYDFWASYGEAESYPRDLEESILATQPLSIVKLCRPSAADVGAWIMDRGLDLPGLADPNRYLFGCLLIFRGKGFIFLDGTANPPERRFTLAHELSHYLRDFVYPLNLAIAKLGPEVSDLFYGLREPSPEERIEALLAGVSLHVQVHLMERGSDNAIIDTHIAIAESEADWLAYELLAPFKDVLRYASAAPGRLSTDEISEIALPLLASVFGLPIQAAERYANRLAFHFGRRLTVTEWLDS